MDLRQLRYFAKVVELESFTAAAETLNVSQPALGMQIRKLEEELGVALLVRHSRGAYATEAGTVLAEHASIIMRRIDVARDELQRFRQAPSGHIRLGITPSVGRALAPEILERSLDLMPDIELSLVQGFGEQLDRDLRAGRIDLTFSAEPASDPRFASDALFGERMYLIGVPAMLSDLPEPLRIGDVVDLPLALDSHVTELRRRLDALSAQRGARLRHVVEVDFDHHPPRDRGARQPGDDHALRPLRRGGGGRARRGPRARRAGAVPHALPQRAARRAPVARPVGDPPADPRPGRRARAQRPAALGRAGHGDGGGAYGLTSR